MTSHAAQLREALELTAKQATDDGLWFKAQYVSEAYLQQELRKLHAAVEALSLPSPSAGLCVPLKPTEAQWGGLARSIMMWLDMHHGPAKTPANLFLHLKRSGKEIPQWLIDEPEMKHFDHVPSKGTRCAIIYRAMLEDFRPLPAPPETPRES